MDLQLTRAVAIVTGGASGIGRACVDALSAEGMRVIILDRDPRGAEAAATLTTQGRDVEFRQVDITDEDQVKRSVEYVVDSRGGLDVVIGCAGVSGPVGATVAETSADEFDQVFAINVRGNFLLAKHVVPHLEASGIGTMVILASDAALVAFDGMAAYNTSKAAVVMLAKSIAVDHPAVRVNAVCPGIVDTPMSRADLGRVEEGFEGSGLPVMLASQLAGHVLFLASPVSAPVNATTLVSDFGYTARSALGSLDFSG